MTVESINKDLEKIQKLYGAAFIRVLCASIIFEHCDWNWITIRTGIIRDPDSKKLLVNGDHQ